MKKQIFRKCVGCLKVKPKDQMIRFVRVTMDDGRKEIIRDETLKANGRGAYLCKNKECLYKAQKGRKFERSFKCTLGEDFYEKIDFDE